MLSSAMLWRAVRSSILFALAVVWSCVPSLAQTGSAQITGSVAYRERIALPADAVIDIQLQDVSIAAVSAQVVAETMINAEGRQVPVPFALAYDPAQIVPDHRYSLRATIRSGDGMLMFSTTQSYPVITHSAPSKVSLILHTVGHGAKPGAKAVKRQAEMAPNAPSLPTSESVSGTPSPSAEESKASAQTHTETVSQSNGAVSINPPPPETKPEPSENNQLIVAPAETRVPQGAAEPAQAEPRAVESEAEAGVPGTKAVASETTTSEPPAKPAESEPKEIPTPAKEAGMGRPPESAAPEASSTDSQSRPAESGDRANPPEAAPAKPAEATSTQPEAKAAEPEPPLPEAPSAVAKLEPRAAESGSAETTFDPETESSSHETGPIPGAGNKPGSTLADTQWRLIELAGADVIIERPSRPLTLAFSPDGTRIAGSSGCNSYIGTFTDDHGRLAMHPGTMSMIGCPDALLKREQKFVATLRAADGFRISGDYLYLTSSGKVVAKFKNFFTGP